MNANDRDFIKMLVDGDGKIKEEYTLDETENITTL